MGCSFEVHAIYLKSNTKEPSLTSGRGCHQIIQLGTQPGLLQTAKLPLGKSQRPSPRPSLPGRAPHGPGTLVEEDSRGPRRPDWYPPLQGLTEMMRSPFLSSPLRSAGPPARMKETKIPSPSSPPTMLKPSPVEPRCSTSFRGSLKRRNELQSLWHGQQWPQDNNSQRCTRHF